MQLGMIGLGRMGANMVRRLLRGGHTCVVYDRAPKGFSGQEVFCDGRNPDRAAQTMVGEY